MKPERTPAERFEAARVALRRRVEVLRDTMNVELERLDHLADAVKAIDADDAIFTELAHQLEVRIDTMITMEH